jgi:hypothetical protein
MRPSTFHLTIAGGLIIGQLFSPWGGGTNIPLKAMSAGRSSVDSSRATKMVLKALDAYPEVVYSDAYMAANYDLVTLHSGHADRARHIKRLNPKVRLLFYRLAHGTWDWQENWDEINPHESWFMHDPSGRRTRNADPDDAFYLMDIRNPEFRTYQIRYVMKFVNTYGFDGLAWDGPPGALTGVYDFSPGPDRSAAATWHRNILTFLREMKQALGSKLLITNSTPTHDPGVPGAEDSDFLAYVDGTSIEGFAHTPWDRYTDVPDGTWDWTQRMAQRNLSAGKYLFALYGVNLEGAPIDQVKRWQIFTLASFLLHADGARAYYQWGPWGLPPNQQDPIFPEMNLDLGTPLGPAYSSNGVWQRDFTRGKVLVNASESRQRMQLHLKFRSLTNTAVTELMLGPWTATILRK